MLLRLSFLCDLTTRRDAAATSIRATRTVAGRLMLSTDVPLSVLASSCGGTV
jgi:hypothetical protein